MYAAAVVVCKIGTMDEHRFIKGKFFANRELGSDTAKAQTIATIWLKETRDHMVMINDYERRCKD